MADTTGYGTQFYFDADSDSQYRLAGCIYNPKPPGKNRAEFSEEPCINSDVITKGLGPLMYSDLSFQLDVDVNDTLDGELHAAIVANTQCLAAIKLNYTTPEYMLFTVQIKEIEFAEFTRENRVRYNISMLCLTDPNASISTTAPTLEA